MKEEELSCSLLILFSLNELVAKLNVHKWMQFNYWAVVFLLNFKLELNFIG